MNLILHIYHLSVETARKFTCLVRTYSRMPVVSKHVDQTHRAHIPNEISEHIDRYVQLSWICMHLFTYPKTFSHFSPEWVFNVFNKSSWQNQICPVRWNGLFLYFSHYIAKFRGVMLIHGVCNFYELYFFISFYSL